MKTDDIPICPLPNIGHCVGERCNYWDPDEGCRGAGICFGFDPSFNGAEMNPADQTICPIVQGFCLYERCPYWDAARQECDASCRQSPESSDPVSADDPCSILWTEDLD